MISQAYFAPRFDIRIAGVFLAADISGQVLSVTYDNDLDVASMFRIVMYNADNSLLDSALFDLGKTVEIHMGYGQNLVPMILGEVTAIEPDFSDGPPTVTITGYDKSYRMRHNQPEPQQYRYVNDSVIAMQIAIENGLIPIVDLSPILHLEKPILQSESDMAFLKERARANFFDVYVWWNNLYFQFPRPQMQAYVLEWGQNLSSFSPRISSSGLAGLQVIRGYSEELAQTIVAFALSSNFNPEDLLEKLGSAGLDLLVSLGRRASHTETFESPVDAFVIAKSLLQDILDGLYEGSGSCIGIPNLQAGQYVEIRGVGKRFSGTYRLRKVVHTIDHNGYRTTFQVTQRSNANLLGLLRKSIKDLPAPDTQEKYYGVMVAKVSSNVEVMDVPPALPLGRVKVTFPSLSDDMQSGWARCVMPMAGSGKGVYFLPEVGDEVLVAFEGGNLSKPVVLGSMWNAQQLPPANNTDMLNNIRMIKTRSGHTLTFDDTVLAPKVVIKSSGGHSVTLDDNPVAPQIVIQDKGQSTIILNSSDGSVAIVAKSNLTLKASGNINLTANAVNVSVATTMDVS